MCVYALHTQVAVVVVVEGSSCGSAFSLTRTKSDSDGNEYARKTGVVVMAS